MSPFCAFVLILTPVLRCACFQRGGIIMKARIGAGKPRSKNSLPCKNGADAIEPLGCCHLRLRAGAEPRAFERRVAGICDAGGRSRAALLRDILRHSP